MGGVLSEVYKSMTARANEGQPASPVLIIVQVSVAEAEALAEQFSTPYFEASAKQNINVNEVNRQPSVFFVSRMNNVAPRS